MSNLPQERLFETKDIVTPEQGISSGRIKTCPENTHSRPLIPHPKNLLKNIDHERKSTTGGHMNRKNNKMCNHHVTQYGQSAKHTT
jgi:hypothetical protein